jgi:hypothetical protein
VWVRKLAEALGHVILAQQLDAAGLALARQLYDHLLTAGIADNDAADDRHD